MFVTVLPIANPEYQCDPKLSDEGKVLSVTIVLMRAIKIISGFGLTMNGKHVYCGDFIYSGHTMTFVLAYLVMLECKFKTANLLNQIILPHGHKITIVVLLSVCTFDAKFIFLVSNIDVTQCCRKLGII